ncbi:MAG: alpha/beta fold hydrolase [Desulfobacteraceae bacterium]|nr:alpha/beta fold hydrolase [Desulfobacteraceae bacterium]
MVERIINGKRTATDGFQEIYPFESRFLMVHGHKMHYLDQGNGKPVLMVHGNPTWSFYFRHLVTDLSKDFRAIAPDHIGCGFSDKPGVKDYEYTLKSRVRDLNIFVDHLNLDQKIDLIVHDWGGMIGLAWAMDNLDRIGKITITNTSGFFLPKDKKFPFLLWLVKYISPFATPAVLGLNAFSRGALLLASQKKLSGPVKKGLTAPYNSWQNRIATLKFVQDIPISEEDQSFSIVDRVDKNLSKLDQDKLMFLWGSKDFVFDLSFLNEWRRRFPRAQTHVFHDAGHYLFEDKPDETSYLIKRFIEQ